MKKYCVLFILPFFLSGCISTQRIDQIVCSTRDSFVRPALTQDYLTINCNNICTLNKFVKSTNLKSLFIPAIFYWQWNNDIQIEVSPKTLCNYIGNNMLSVSDSLHLKEKLGNRRLEISIENIPNTFTYMNDGYAVIVLVAYMVGGAEVIIPQQQNFCLTYQVYDNNTLVKTGKVTLPSRDHSLKNGMRSTRKFILDYLDQYRSVLNSLSKEAMVQISSGL